jgi:serine/threonine protein phosphatase PrpC
LSGPASPAFDVAGATDIGTVRKENQDDWTTFVDERGVALLLADGMGGHVGGGEAATAAIAAAASSLREDATTAADQRLLAASRAASAAVSELRSRIGGAPGTTLVLALVASDGAAAVANIGDSRAYLVREQNAEALTEDHSWVGEQVRLGQMSEDEARHSTRRNIITRAVLGDDERPDVFTATLAVGDTLLLCSDGVWEPLTDTGIASVLGEHATQRDAAMALCRAAIEAGSRDNVTAVTARRLR